MGMNLVNIKTIRKCAFCKYWYDPTNRFISPRNPRINMWEFDDKAKCKCLKANYDMPSVGFCGKFELKLEIIEK